MSDVQQKRIEIITLIIIFILSFVGCKFTQNNKLQKTNSTFMISCKIENIDVLGDAVLNVSSQEFNETGFSLGDSINISFSNGYTLSDIPYYNDFYGMRGDIMIADINNVIKIGGQYYNFAQASGIYENLDVKITLNEKQRYLSTMNLYYLKISNNLSDYPSVIQFINAREIQIGKIKKGTLFRSTSPFNDKYNRQKETGEFIKVNKIHTILNLADTHENIEKYKNIPEHTLDVYKSGNVIISGVGINFYTDEFCNQLTNALKKFIEKKGPYLIHCTLGRDRTGFVCLLLEALMEGTYNEIVDDYMLSFYNLHQLDKNIQSEKYNLYKEEVDDIIKYLCKVETNEALTKEKLQNSAERYLLNGGMSIAEISKLKSLLGYNG